MHDTRHLLEELNRLRRNFPASPRVNRFEVQEGFDSTGDPALYIWVLLRDDTPPDEQTSDKVRPIKERIVRALREAGESRWPYVRFRTEAEYQEMVQA